jgi:hypothetical protein
MQATVPANFWADYPLATRQSWEGAEESSVVAPEVEVFCRDLSKEDVAELNRSDLFTPVMPAESLLHEKSGLNNICGVIKERNNVLIELGRSDRAELKRNVSVYGCGIDYSKPDFLAASRAFRRVFPSGDQLSKLATSNFLRTADKFFFPETYKREGIFFATPGRECNAAAVEADVVTTPALTVNHVAKDLIYFDQGGYDEGIAYSSEEVEWLYQRYREGHDMVVKWDLKKQPPFPVVKYKKMRPHNDEVVLLVLQGKGEAFDCQELLDRRRYFNMLRDEMIMARSYQLDLDLLNTEHDHYNKLLPVINRGHKPRNRIRFTAEGDLAGYRKLCREKGDHPKPLYNIRINLERPYAFVDVTPHNSDYRTFFLNLVHQPGVEFDPECGWFAA